MNRGLAADYRIAFGNVADLSALAAQYRIGCAAPKVKPCHHTLPVMNR
jgi:hypothetical protein